MFLKKGDTAPDFTASSDKAGEVTLSQLKGKKVVLFFYPKDDTPGCTKESCEFRDLLGEFDAKNAQVYGISADDLDSHKQFSAKFGLNFPLIADPDHQICEAYGVWGEQEWNGKKYEGISRTTYVVGEDGLIAKVYEKVDPVGHAQAVLSAL